MIISHLGFFDKHALGLISRHFSTLIPPPTYDELELFEKALNTWVECDKGEDDSSWCHPLDHFVPGPWAVCIGCKRLRLRTKFGMKSLEEWPDEDYICVECGTRPLPGEYRYAIGEIWWDGERRMIRCPVCGLDTDARETDTWDRFWWPPDKTDKCKRCYEEASGLMKPSCGFCEK